MSNSDKLDSVELDNDHTKRFNHRTYGSVLGWVAFICFIVGTGMSAFTFDAYVKAKAAIVEKKQAVIKTQEAVPKQQIQPTAPVPVKKYMPN